VEEAEEEEAEAEEEVNIYFGCSKGHFRKNTM
jgi:hypothetical protein